MLKVENRESAHVKSRVYDRSVVPNIIDFVGLFAAITPISKVEENADGCYDPILVRDTDTLIANFGDPRIDPEKYIDLYSIMQVVGNGASCYIAKVPSGKTGVYNFNFISALPADGITLSEVADGKKAAAVITIDGGKQLTCTAKSNGEDGNNISVAIVAADDAFTVTVSKSGDNPTTETFSNKATAADLISVESALVDFSCDDSEAGLAEAAETALTGGLDDTGVNYTGTCDVPVNVEEVTVTLSDSSSAIYDREALKSIKCEQGAESYTITVVFKDNPNAASAKVTKIQAVSELVAYSSMTEDITFDCSLTQAKPYSLKAFYLNIALKKDDNTLCSAKVKLDPTTTNKDIVNVLNSNLGTYVRFELGEGFEDTAQAAEVNDLREKSIAAALLNTYAPHAADPAAENAEIDIRQPRQDLFIKPKTDLVSSYTTVDSASFEVGVNDYIKAYNQFKDRRYVGCLMADLTAPLTHTAHSATEIKTSFGAPTPEERRSLHFYLKEAACERKNTTVVLSTPLRDNDNGDENSLQRYDGTTLLTMDEICDWVSSNGKYKEYWNYGETNTTNYAEQSFYLEMYDSWLKQQCTHVVDGVAKSAPVEVAPANLVINNILTSFRERGTQYPVAGDQYGTLPDTCTVIKNPKTKLERDQLVQYRINPIWDTGTRGIQIYGNETLNAGYTDLNAAHIARTLVYLRSLIDEYTEKLKFSINSMILWDTWKNYVSQYILEPLKSANALSEYSVEMGTDTTSAAEIANRTINGVISLIFYQSAEIFNLSYVVYSSATTLEEGRANQ